VLERTRGCSSPLQLQGTVSSRTVGACVAVRDEERTCPRLGKKEIFGNTVNFNRIIITNTKIYKRTDYKITRSAVMPSRRWRATFGVLAKPGHVAYWAF